MTITSLPPTRRIVTGFELVAILEAGETLMRGRYLDSARHPSCLGKSLEGYRAHRVHTH
jgi:hypothetical protein